MELSLNLPRIPGPQGPWWGSPQNMVSEIKLTKHLLMMWLRHPSIIETLPNEFPDLKHEFGKQSTIHEHQKMSTMFKKTCIFLFQCKMFRQAWVPNVWPPKDQDLPSLPCPAWCKRQVNEAHWCCIRGPFKGKWALNFRPSPRNWRD